MYGIMAVHKGHAYIGMVEGLPREISEVIHHTTGCIGLERTLRSEGITTVYALGGRTCIWLFRHSLSENSAIIEHLSVHLSVQACQPRAMPSEAL